MSAKCKRHVSLDALGDWGGGRKDSGLVNARLLLLVYCRLDTNKGSKSPMPSQSGASPSCIDQPSFPPVSVKNCIWVTEFLLFLPVFLEIAVRWERGGNYFA